MLRDIAIQNYRCFKDFQIDGLAQVNLLVGRNNSGKTSLLEAIDLLVNQEKPERLFEQLLNRREFVERRVRDGATPPIGYFQIEHLFYERQMNTDRIIEVRSRQDRPLSLEIQLSLGAEQIWFNRDLLKPDFANLELTFLYGEDNKMTIPVSDEGLIPSGHFLRKKKPAKGRLWVKTKNLSSFLTSRRLDFSQIAANLWKHITLTPEEETVVKALQILDPDVEGINFPASEAANQQGLVKRKGQHQLIPLASMGEGMTQILNLMASAVTIENGVLLVDNIDSGLHHDVQTDMWKLLWKTAERRNLQIFATTQSYDCASAFSELLQESEDRAIGKLFRLDSKYGKLRAVDYPPEVLAVAVEQSIEVR